MNRRYKRLRVSSDLILKVLTHRHIEGGYVTLLEMPLEAGTSVVTVHFDYATNCFAYILENESWDENEDGVEIPDMEFTCVNRKLALA